MRPLVSNHGSHACSAMRSAPGTAANECATFREYLAPEDLSSGHSLTALQVLAAPVCIQFLLLATIGLDYGLSQHLPSVPIYVAHSPGPTLVHSYLGVPYWPPLIALSPRSSTKPTCTHNAQSPNSSFKQSCFADREVKGQTVRYKLASVPYLTLIFSFF